MFQALFRRYVAASVVALGADFAVFMCALRLGIAPAPAAAGGYFAGVICHWMISSRAVFVGRVAEKGPRRSRQQALFMASALIGLAVTTSIVGLGAGFGLYPPLAKLIAIGVSFQLTYVLRQKVVFA